MEEVKKLKTQLKWASIEKELLLSIIRENCDFPIDSVMGTFNNGCIEVNELKDRNIRVLLKKAINNCDASVYDWREPSVNILLKRAIGSNKKDKTYTVPYEKAVRYYTVKNAEKELPAEIEIEIENEKSFDDLKKEMEDFFNDLSQLRIYADHFKKLGCIFANILVSTRITVAVEYLKTTVKRLEEYLKLKKLPSTKIKSLILSNIPPVITRLVLFSGFHEKLLTADDISLFEKSISLKQCNQLTIFSKEGFVESLSNYGLCILPLEKMLKNVIVNKYGFSSIVYFSIGKSTNEDPYTFYYLSVCSAEERKWKMDCRLEGLTQELCDSVLSNSIFIFRTIYFEVFRDNKKRDRYTEKAGSVSPDLQQLYENILLLGSYTRVNKILKDLVKENCTKPVTIYDKINMTSDDKMRNKLSDDPKFLELLEVRLFD